MFISIENQERTPKQAITQVLTQPIPSSRLLTHGSPKLPRAHPSRSQKTHGDRHSIGALHQFAEPRRAP